jgi:hypothetical protein
MYALLPPFVSDPRDFVPRESRIGEMRFGLAGRKGKMRRR